MHQGEPDGEAGVDLLAAVRRHPLAFLLPIVVLALALGAYGALRDPEYTAESRLSVGRLDVTTQGLPGFTQAGTTIAAALSRAVDAPAVSEPAAQAVGISPGAARSALRASPIPETPLIRIEAERENEDQAVRLANAAADALVAYGRKLGTAAGGDEELLERYSALSREVRRLTIARDRTAERFARRPSDARRISLQNADGKLRAVTLERDALGNRYGAEATGESIAGLLTVLAPAADAASDRDDTRDKLALTGAIAGLVIGLALAALLESRRRRRTAA